MNMRPDPRPDTDRTAPGDRPDAARTGVTIAEAASHLGVTTDAVRRRLHRGTLPGAKNPDGTWLVHLAIPEQSPDIPRHDEPPGNRPDGSQAATGQRPDPPGLPPGEVIALYQSIVADKDEEIAFLRDQLDQRSRELAAERERSDVIQQLALNRIPPLQPGTDASEQATTRTEAQESPLTGQGEAKAANTTPNTSQSHKWWEFWKP